MPMADKYLSSRSASEKGQEAALAALAAGVRGELRLVTEAHTGIDRQLQEQSAQVAEVAVEVTRTRMGIESVEARVAKLEKTAGTAVMLLAAGLVLLVGVLTLLVVLSLEIKAR